MHRGGSDNKGDGLASQPRRYRVPGQPLLNRHHVGGISRSPDGLFAQQEWEHIRGRPTVRGKRTYGGRPGQRVEEQGTWAARTRKHSEAGYGFGSVVQGRDALERSYTAGGAPPPPSPWTLPPSPPPLLIHPWCPCTNPQSPIPYAQGWQNPPSAGRPFCRPPWLSKRDALLWGR